MEVDIYCNVVKCRKFLALEEQACVTSCSHIFCVPCSNNAFSKALLCPACNTSLTGNEDIVLTELNPTEEYKSSVLAGLKPEVILDITSRAIAFYEYQQSQEVLYRTILQKNTQEKYTTLKHKFIMTARDSNQIIKAEKDKLIALTKEFEAEKQRSKQAHTKLEEKNKQFQKLQTMYEKLKRKTTVISSIQQEQPQKGLPTHCESNAASSTSLLFHNSHHFQFQPPNAVSTSNQQNQVLRLNGNRAVDKPAYTAGNGAGGVDRDNRNDYSNLGGDGTKTVFAQAIINSSRTTNLSVTSPTKIPSPIHPMYAAYPRNSNGLPTATITTARYDHADSNNHRYRHSNGVKGKRIVNHNYYQRPAPPLPTFQSPAATTQRQSRHTNSYHCHSLTNHQRQQYYARSRSVSPHSNFKTYSTNYAHK